MATQRAGLGAALAVLVVVAGLAVLVGVILLLLWFQPGIQHSPSAQQTGAVMQFSRHLTESRA